MAISQILGFFWDLFSHQIPFLMQAFFISLANFCHLVTPKKKGPDNPP
jgi:hypothetical protein